MGTSTLAPGPVGEAERPAPAAPGPYETKRGKLRPARERAFWPFLLPALLGYTVLFVLPALYGFWVSLNKWAGPGSDMEWKGLANYTALLENDAFRTSFVNTFVLALGGGVAVFGFTFLSMVVLRQAKGRGFIRSVVFLPMIISLIAVGAAIGFLLNPNGAVNTVFGWLGLDPQPWLGPDMVFRCVIGGLVWSSTGFYVALMMSAADSIPPYLYEDAKLIGATRWEQFRYITLPLTWDVFAVCAVLWVVNSLKVFEIVIAFTTAGTPGSPPLQARTVAVQQFLSVTNNGGAPDLGSAAAMGVFVLIVTTVLVWLTRRITRRERVELS
ncbi:ABC transporter permease [Streptomyces spiroverticillatus]|uniref:ABC transporter permease n=1 Tax=Streptomyces finlayi TaxID=67296 RepID=A0A919C9P9_9ACTN|nr:sugar ABC transporter permease [Streptomyces finlayi]GHA08586.1 ABC transporter permease [Streptomyces spiroverticillatus]GHC91515.1 ABC transporter permease [Streptomyces finlayi]